MTLYLSLQNPKRMTLNELYEHGRNGTSEGLRAELESQGYDGIIAESEFNKSNSEYVAFYPEQIKSATGKMVRV